MTDLPEFMVSTCDGFDRPWQRGILIATKDPVQTTIVFASAPVAGTSHVNKEEAQVFVPIDDRLVWCL